jgi:transposase InsO family protein
VHQHWHVDIAYVKVSGIFYFLPMLLDGYSRYVLDWELMTDMLSTSVQEFIQRAREKYPNSSPMLIHDNGS